jgi:hypothetical protein
MKEYLDNRQLKDNNLRLDYLSKAAESPGTTFLSIFAG